MQQWSKALTQYAQHSLVDERQYWLDQLSMPVAKQINNQRQSTLAIELPQVMKSCQLLLSPEATQAIIGHCNDAYLTTINELLLSALSCAWQQWTGQNTLRIEMESHGREELFEDIDISETVGWFTALYPQVISGDSANVGQTIVQVKEQYRALPNRGLGFGLLKYTLNDPQIKVLDNVASECAVIFNYLGQFDTTTGLPQLFDSTGEATGFNASPEQQQNHLLAINGMVSEQQLSFSISYHTNRIDDAEVATLTRLFEQSLMLIVNHCEDKNTDVRLYQQNASLIINPQQDMSDEGIEI